MANDQLTAGVGSGAEATTQSPQAASGAPNFGNQPSRNPQSSAAGDLQGGLQINGSSLGNVTLDVPASNNAQAVTVLPLIVHHHHPNQALIGVSAMLLVLAVVMAWFMTRAAKNTTDYS